MWHSFCSPRACHHGSTYISSLKHSAYMRTTTSFHSAQMWLGRVSKVTIKMFFKAQRLKDGWQCKTHWPKEKIKWSLALNTSGNIMHCTSVTEVCTIYIYIYIMHYTSVTEVCTIYIYHALHFCYRSVHYIYHTLHFCYRSVHYIYHALHLLQKCALYIPCTALLLQKCALYISRTALLLQKCALYIPCTALLLQKCALYPQWRSSF